MINEFYQKAFELDKKDELVRFKEAFVSEPNTIYLDGNSLGKLPKKTIVQTNALVTNQWGKGLIRSWNDHWIDLPQKTATKLAQIVGAQPDEIFVGDSTSLNLYKLAFAALNLNQSKKKIISDNLNFPTDLYILQGLIEQQFKDHSLKIIESQDGITVDEKQFEEAIDNQVALVVLSHVVFKSAFMYDMAHINDLAHQKDALFIWDLSHSVGSVPVNLNESGADMAVGCTYKYLNGGPGAPAFLYVRKDLQKQLQSPIWAWFSHQAPFDFSLDYQPKDTIQRFAVGTPSVLSLAAIESGLDITLEAGIDRLRTKSQHQSEFLIELIQQLLVPQGFRIVSPLNANQRGSHISISHPEGYRISQAMIKPNDESKVIVPDFRPPDNIRLGIAPLYNTFTELVDCVERIWKIVAEDQYKQYSTERLTVT
ncbi:kynureninase [Emticicia sp. C21]|uniref:kynureninase n=1 Tax=Emticicia sp. C21 TaxID=2302915 RepID=UPI000E34C698|nr:kynureninase [Emticicia sp. C21]RFS17591.1 kynureninase [Emticicia sp. C21]